MLNIYGRMGYSNSLIDKNSLCLQHMEEVNVGGKKHTGIGTFAARTALYWAIYCATFRTPNFRKSLKLFVQPLAKK